MAYGDSSKDSKPKKRTTTRATKKTTTVKLKDSDGKEKPVTFKTGGLHKALGVPMDEDLPKGIMTRIKNADVGDMVTVKGKKVKVTEKLKKQAVLGLNLSKGTRK
tara:strand:+ start:1413 stop:1727 length:315 start_codon:yes stop_codon:yes gene_type:complete